MKLTYFVHSTTEDNKTGIATGWNDIPLSELGFAQAAELRGVVESLQFDAVISSDLLRAKQTAEIAFEQHVVFDHRWRECNYGALNGTPNSGVYPLANQGKDVRYPSGESCSDVELRVREALSELIEQYPNGHVAIVSHKYPQLALDVIVHGHTWEAALANDWRKTGAWQPGWEYEVITL